MISIATSPGSENLESSTTTLPLLRYVQASMPCGRLYGLLLEVSLYRPDNYLVEEDRLEIDRVQQLEYDLQNLGMRAQQYNQMILPNTATYRLDSGIGNRGSRQETFNQRNYPQAQSYPMLGQSQQPRDRDLSRAGPSQPTVHPRQAPAYAVNTQQISTQQSSARATTNSMRRARSRRRSGNEDSSDDD